MRSVPGRALLLAGIVAATLGVWAAPASAHADLAGSDPSDGTSIPEAPGEIRLSFSEAVSASPGSVRVEDARGRVVASSFSVEGTSVVVAVPELPDGAYLVTWSLVAEGDGHVTRGTIAFGVGAAAPVREPAPAPIPTVEVALSWILVASLVVVVGALCLVRFVLVPAAGAAPALDAPISAAGRRALGLAAAAAVSAIAAGTSLLAVRASALGGPDAAASLLLDTGWGTAWLARSAALGLAAVAAVALRRGSSERLWMLSGLSVATAALAQAAGGHAAALPERSLVAVASGAAHLLAAGVWVGGVVTMVVALRARGARGTGAHRPVLRRFWKVAAPAVGIVAATGLYGAGRQLGSIDAATGSAYGIAILGKALLLLAAGALGLAVAISVRRGLASAPRRLVVAEAAVGLAILLGAAFAAATPPSRSLVPPPAAPSTRVATAGDLVVSLSVRPNVPGENVVEALVASERRPEPAEVGDVTLRVTGADGAMAQEAMTEVAPGRYRVGVDLFEAPGRWTVDLMVEREGLDAAVAGFDWRIGGAGGSIQGSPLEGPLTAAAAVILLMTAAATALLVSPRRKPGPVGSATALTARPAEP